MSFKKTLDCPYKDWAAFKLNAAGTLGYPRLECLDQHRVIVSSWDGRCYLLDFQSQIVTPCPPVNTRLPVAGNCAKALSVGMSESGPICAAAMDVGWTSIWHLGDHKAASIYPVKPGPVSAVAIHPKGHRIALGLGYYSLAPGEATKAYVELWTLDSPPQFSGFCRIPGIVVDQLAWDEMGNRLLVVSGDLQQQSGHVVILDGDTLAAGDIEPIEFALCKGAHFCGDEEALLIASGQMEIRKTDNLSTVRWRLFPDSEIWSDGSSRGDIYQAAISPCREVAIMNNGLLVDCWEGRIAGLPALPDCTGIAALQNGDCVGISSAGIVRVWDQPVKRFKQGL